MRPVEVSAASPADLDELVARLLAKDPRDRYASAAEVADEIARLAGVHHLREDLQRNESYLISDVMIGREQEFGTLEQLVESHAIGGDVLRSGSRGDQHRDA